MNSAPSKRRKNAKFFAKLRCTFLARKSAKSSPISALLRWRHFRLSLSLSLYYRKRESASFIVREVQSVRERDGSSETEVVTRKWRHHCRAKLGDKFELSLARNSHLSFPPSHFPSLPSRRGYLYETSKISIKLIQKLLEIEKEIVREDARVLKIWRKINCSAQIITRRSRYGFWWFVRNNWFFFNFLTPAHLHAHVQSLFLFPIVFGINLSLSLSAPHAQYRKRFRPSYNKKNVFSFHECNQNPWPATGQLQLIGFNTTQLERHKPS